MVRGVVAQLDGCRMKDNIVADAKLVPPYTTFKMAEHTHHDRRAHPTFMLPAEPPTWGKVRPLSQRPHPAGARPPPCVLAATARIEIVASFSCVLSFT